MKGNALLLLFYGVMVFTYHSLIITPGTCLGNNTEPPDVKGKHLLSEKLDQKDHNVSPFSNTKKTKPVSDHGEASENLLVRTNEGNILKGKDLYKKLCQKCHDAYSTQNTTGPGLQGILKNDVLPSSKKLATVQNVLDQLNNPVDRMPSFHFLSEEEKLSIIAFLNTL